MIGYLKISMTNKKTATRVVAQLVMLLVVGLTSLHSLYHIYGMNIYVNSLLCYLYLAILVGLSVYYIFRQWRITITYIDVVVAVYLLYILLNSLYTYGSIGLLYQYLLIPCGYIIFRLLFSLNTALCLLSFKRAIIISGALQAMYGVFQLLTQRDQPGFMICGTIYNSGPYALWLVISYTYSLYAIVFDKNRITRRLSLATIFLVLVILPATYSRTSLVILFVISCAIAMLDNRMRAKLLSYKKYLGVALAALAIIAVALFYIKKESALGRLFLWEIGFKTYLEAPLLGSGIDSYNSVASRVQIDYFKNNPQLSNSNIFYADIPNSPFNEYLLVLSEQGIIGLVLFLMLMVAAIYILRAKGKRGWDSALVIIALMLYAFTSYTLQMAIFQTLLVVTIVVAACFGKPLALPRYTTPLLIVLLWYMLITSINTFDIKPHHQLQRVYRGSQVVVSDMNLKILRSIETELAHSSRYNYALSFILNRNGHYQESLDVINTRLANEQSPMLYILKARNYQSLGDSLATQQNLLNAYYLVPSRFYPLHVLKQYYFDANEYQKCRDVCDRIVAMPEKVRNYNSQLIKRQADSTLILLNSL